jgi:hypothetical protein
MKRSPLIKIPLNAIQTRYRLTYEGEPCEPSTTAGRVEQFAILQQLVDQPQLCYTGNVLFDTLKIHHDGVKWVVELEALETQA